MGALITSIIIYSVDLDGIRNIIPDNGTPSNEKKTACPNIPIPLNKGKTFPEPCCSYLALNFLHRHRPYARFHEIASLPKLRECAI